ncbi:Hvo_1808 family surface protein [Halanaeroarchaeum sulfurireducens]|uniref:Lipoprotein n=1 Tax=Halanaeroarchaeum sulfurireducens TaxID=1604004 RepID=A0A0F7PBQ7_9EURY|nr:Hvo_1808 family surface protein [Halanaeroarchaeum sulfurireducens]AKH96773.1 hypothetical protein HLASF_0264 [Halanaeroarchaeum sulfurireducens]ALG81175.1 hypothetical protein HLASA_0264 [Halanaeroarchaeum sulfurireducens]
MRRSLVVLAVLGLVVTAGCLGSTPAPAGPAEPVPTTTATDTTTSVHPADPPEDTLGWEDGYWYNETLDVDRSDGLNDSELDAVVSRAMARVEHIRGLEFEHRVPVEIISREEHTNRTSGQYENVSQNGSLHQNVKYEATFLMGESTSAVGQQERNQASNVLGYYSPGQDRIVIVSEDTDSPRIDEVTLAQELFHALQEHRFNVSEYEANTEETHNARMGIVEGDANYVDYRYEQEFIEDDENGSAGGSDVHLGLLALRSQPYSDGPVFVDERYEEGGWDAVNAVYDDPPQSTEQTIHTEKYRTDEPTEVRIDDRSAAAWAVPDLGNGSVDYAQFGEAGMYVMLWYPSYETKQDVVIPLNNFLDTDGEVDLYNYDHRYSAGWDGDRLLPYTTNDSAETGETGYVWKSVWDSETEATQFLDGYHQLLEHHNAEPVPERPNTYRISEGEFADAFYVEQSGETVVIVNAPTVEELTEVREGAGAAE